jgi:hypothetical protein
MAEEKKLRCPHCKIGLEVLVRAEGQDDTFKVSVHRNPSHSAHKTDRLRSALMGFWRWCAEGKLPHGHGGQYYYDQYHEGIRYDPETKEYRFSIQVSDSPEGDTWWSGKFRYAGGEIGEIADESFERS